MKRFVLTLANLAILGLSPALIAAPGGALSSPAAQAATSPNRSAAGCAATTVLQPAATLPFLQDSPEAAPAGRLSAPLQAGGPCGPIFCRECFAHGGTGCSSVLCECV